MLEDIPRKNRSKGKWVTFRLESDLDKKIDQLAAKENTTKSEIFRYAVKQLLKKLDLMDDK